MSPKESVRNYRVIGIIREGVGRLGVRGLARAVGISPAIVTRYMQGKVGEPSQATLEKLAEYFQVSVPYLRGESALKALRYTDTPPTEVEINEAYRLNVMESVLAVERGIKKYPELWELFLSIPDEHKGEAFSVLETYMSLSIAAHRLFWERSGATPKP